MSISPSSDFLIDIYDVYCHFQEKNTSNENVINHDLDVLYLCMMRIELHIDYDDVVSFFLFLHTVLSPHHIHIPGIIFSTEHFYQLFLAVGTLHDRVPV